MAYYFKGNGFSFEINKRTYIMGILNVTPDSFFDGGQWNSPEKAVKHALKMQENGADIIDIGAQSTRPGSILLSEDEELEIIKKYIPAVTSAVNVPVSVDTFYPRVAEYCLENGAKIINDVSSKMDRKMALVVKKHNAGWIVMHTGNASASQEADYSKCGGVVNDVLAFFDKAEKIAAEYAISRENICFDMGFGFGKSHNDNLELLRNINKLKSPERALLTALSCKRLVKNETGADGYDRVFGTLAADTLAIAGGTDFIRVHHVKEACLAAKMT
mgnify:FL=1